MKHPIAAAIAIAIACLPMAAAAQDKPAFALRTFEASKQKNARITALRTSLSQKIDAAFKGEEKLRAAMTADLKAIQAEKNPQARKSLAAAYRARYDKDAQRILVKSKIDMQSVASQLRAIDPGTTYTVVANRVVSQPPASQEPPAAAPPPPPPAATTTVKDLQGADYKLDRNSDCASGQGETTQSGGYMKSESEGCQTSGLLWHEFDVPADKTVRIEMSANLYAEAHTIASIAHSDTKMSLFNLTTGRMVEMRSVTAWVIELMFGDDALQDSQGASIVRDLAPGRYRIEAYTESYGSDHTPGWAIAEAKLQTLRVKLTTSPR